MRIDHRIVMKEWHSYLSTERDIRPITAARYALHVRNWLAYLGRRRKHFTDATREDCAKWWAQCKTRYSSSSCVQILCALRQFYDWATERGWYDGFNYWHRFERPQVTHGARPVIAEEDMYRLLNTQALDTWQNVRNRTIVAFLYATGLRVSECAAVSIHEVDLQQKVVYVRNGKGGKTRKQPLPDAIIPLLEEWIEVRSLRASGTGALFVSRTGKRLGPQGIRDATKAWCQATGLKHLPMNPHVLRKSACTHIYLHGRDIHAVQKFAGHSRPDVTQRYIATGEAYVHEVVAKHHPLSIWARNMAAR